MDAVTVSNNWVSVLTVVRHSLSRSSEAGSRQVVVYRVSKGGELTLSEVDLTVTLGVLFAQSPAPGVEPLGVLGRVTSPHGAGVTVVTTLVDGTLGGDNVGLNVVANTSRNQHLHSFDRHLDDVTVGQGLSSYNRVGVGVKDVHTK